MKKIVKQDHANIRDTTCVELRVENKFLKQPERERSTLRMQSERCMIEMQFCVKQPDDGRWARLNKSPLTSLPSCPHLIWFPGFKETISFSSIANTGIIKLNIRFNLTFLEAVTGEDCPRTLELLEQISGEKFNYAVEKNANITPHMKIIINELLCCDKTGTVKRLFWQSKILELLMLEIEQMEDANRPISSIKYYDVEKLQEAKSIVENNLAKPYSLKTLAHKVGLNDFKLKRGFKELFGYTVFGYLRELRMQQAKKLLLTGKDSVTGISGEVGYQHSHHFSAAFKKRFGVLPGALNK